MYLPHQFIEHQLQHRFDQTIRRNYFRGMDFAGPAGDPGWFGPGSAVWHVHSHTEALVFGLQCAAFIERLDPSIYWMGMHHSRLVQRDENGVASPVIDPKGAVVRFGHSIAFFIGTAYGNTETAENLARTVRAMHHTIKGVRPDGAAYDADDPDWLRWTARRWCGAWPPRTSFITRTRCAARNLTGTTASSSASGTPSAAPTCPPPRPRPWTA
ncbi:hypothetical protein MAUB1S_00004 [Mycolicibacterium aubagnense]